ncbi:MAG: glutamine--tRNA ligase/YqeY domain fusion protein [Acholeplasmatales bacterium]|nr:glutamine--tRNA ligase/YqeY domain fusion protein [Acholeplasmatales bacterium]MDD7395557.1 glutamine--tRNA ligase/YqeY domain fusion protein [Acholeplasmatales bacterium]
MMNDNSNFIKTIMKEELDNGVVNHILTRFPPEPNAYLHIGHARAIIMNFELAKCFDGATNLRFDDTNPSKEDTEYIEAIKKDIAWLGYTPKSIHYGSEYFERTYEKAKLLIKKGLAFVDDLTQEQLSEYRGSINEPGKPSPFRNRSVEENLRLFEEMKEGKYANGEKTLRAKIDMASPNINMRDPVIYRIMHVTHHQTKDKWCIYPMYDFAHPLQDAFEGITHSLCSIEFEDHRPLYEWVIANCEVDAKPRQIEWGRLGITHMIMSKRYLKKLVDEKVVEGYDDPRMPTLVGLRRRGFTPNAIKEFILSTGLSKVNSTVDYGMLEHFLREDLKLKTTRPMAVINPLKVIITNYPEGQIEYVDAPNNMENEALGTHKMAFGRELYIEREDFCEVKPNKHWKRLSKDIEVRLMHAYFIKCNEVIKDENGEIVEIHCTYDPMTKSGSGFNERKPNGNIHYVEATTALPATFNSFEPLLLDEKVSTENFMERLNRNSWHTSEGFVEEYLKDTLPEDKYQFIRNGYYTTDKNSKGDNLIFNLTVGLKSSYNA